MTAKDEANKDSGRIAIFGAASTVLTYLLGLVFPKMPTEVQAAILVIVLAAISWVDSYLHNNKKIKLPGLLPF